MAENEGGADPYSMQELQKDLKRVKGGRRLLWFLVGLALGIAGAVVVPPLARPYLPGGLGGGGELLVGTILEEEREGDRLLLTVDADRGALIASFTRRVSEIALLVEPGDSLTLRAPDYEPFLEDPDIESIRKPRLRETVVPGGDESRADTAGAAAPDSAPSAPAAPDTLPEEAAPADSVPPSETGAELRAAAALSGSRTPGSAPPRRT